MEDFKKNTLDILNNINKSVSELSDSLLKSIDAVAASINNINANESALCEKTQNTLREQNIAECIENFDWARIEKVMKHLNWQWYFSTGENGCHVPSIDEMQQKVTEQFMDCYHKLDNDQEQSYTISCGGFEVCVYKDDECSLKFVCSEWNTF